MNVRANDRKNSFEGFSSSLLSVQRLFLLLSFRGDYIFIGCLKLLQALIASYCLFTERVLIVWLLNLLHFLKVRQRVSSSAVYPHKWC